jgi:hypothetical protein
METIVILYLIEEKGFSNKRTSLKEGLLKQKEFLACRFYM